MIKKLERHIREEDGVKISCPPEPQNIMDKINELVDAVNNIISVQEKLIDSRFVVETQHEEPADPYAEQRKWIGKLCRCWDSDINDDIWGILQDIKDNKTEKYYLYGTGYEHCEPVKPDDDIIYKGDK